MSDSHEMACHLSFSFKGAVSLLMSLLFKFVYCTICGMVRTTVYILRVVVQAHENVVSLGSMVCRIHVWVISLGSDDVFGKMSKCASRTHQSRMSCSHFSHRAHYLLWSLLFLCLYNYMNQCSPCHLPPLRKNPCLVQLYFVVQVASEKAR